MAVDDDREDKELFRRGIGFLHRARPLCGLPSGAFARIERRLAQPASKPRRRPLLLAAATLGLLLVAGTAFAVASGGLAHLPVVGPWLAPSPTVSPTPRASKPRHARPSAQPPAPLAAPSSPTEPVTAPAERGTDVAAVAAPPPAPPLAPNGSAGAGASAAPPAVLPRPSGNGDTATPAIGAKPASPVVRKVVLANPPPSPAPAGPAPATAQPTPAPVVPAPAVEPILDESRSLSAAIERWHRDRAASAALGALDEHDRRFANGRLRMEARLLRAEILLAQGREREGLALLDQVTLAGSPRARELFTVRGELRIKLGRCREGRADLDEVLAKGMADAFARRATEALRHCP
jgi:hypothetical protein